MGDGEPVVVLHGLFGVSDNWITVGKNLAEHHSVYLLDLRNHGKSPHSKDFNFDVMILDVLEFLADHQIDKISLVGHSLGGRLAMNFAFRYPHLLNHLIIIDSSPVYENQANIHIVAGIIQLMKSLDFSRIKTRNEADEALKIQIPNYAVRQLLLKNLKRKDKHLAWKLNLNAIEQNLQIINEVVDSDQIFDGKTLFLRGEKSDYIPLIDQQSILELFPNAKIVTIQGAGHWVHADAPEEVTKQILAFLSKK